MLVSRYQGSVALLCKVSGPFKEGRMAGAGGKESEGRRTEGEREGETLDGEGRRGGGNARGRENKTGNGWMDGYIDRWMDG